MAETAQSNNSWEAVEELRASVSVSIVTTTQTLQITRAARNPPKHWQKIFMNVHPNSLDHCLIIKKHQHTPVAMALGPALL